MPTYTMTGPDGRDYSIDGPAGATQEQVVSAIQGQLKEQKMAPAIPQASAPAQSQSLLDSAISGLKNIPSSAGHFVGGIANAVMHPIDTANAVGTAAKGGLENVAYNLTKMAADQARSSGRKPDPMYEAILARGNTPDMTKADAIGQFYKDRYGGYDQLKNTLSNDPVGLLADASMAGGAIGGAAKTVGLQNSGRVIADASSAINPVNIGIQAAKPVLNGAGTLVEKLASNLLGLSTGVGAENIRAAAKSGVAGDASFIDNLSGKADMTDVLDRAKLALQNMRNNRSAEYKAGIATTAADSTPLNFSPIDAALANVTGSMKSGGHWKIGDAEAAKVKEVGDIVGEWRSDPSMHTAIGLDALKQRLDAVYPDSPIHNQAQRAITSVRNAVKDAIVNQSPEYAGTMKAYEEAITLEKEIERALSLGKKASADTALRKLQSLSRNNVNTNYGYRLDLAKALQDEGGQSLLPAIAGQSMNSWMPRGLAGQGGTMATLASSLHNPALLGLLPLQSPKAIGAALYGGGRVAGMGKNAADYMKSQIPLSASEIQKIAAILAQTGNLPQE